MKPLSILVAATALLTISVSGCQQSGGNVIGADSPNATAPASSPAVSGPSTEPERESAETVKNCPALRKSRLHYEKDVANPCAQATHLASLFRRNAHWKDSEGFEIRVGGLSVSGLRLLVSGDLETAHAEFQGDDLVAFVRSVGQGL